MLYIKTFFFLNIDRYLLKKTYCSSLYLIAQRLKKQTKSRKKKSPYHMYISHMKLMQVLH